jgi:predicted unusual protein kinase regulating ubiquinone biosynthesis (AarF/ABC1/UbiB family)
VQYPGAGDALLADLKQRSRLASMFKIIQPGMDIKPLLAELRERITEELDYVMEADTQRAFATAYAGDPEIFVPRVVASAERVLVTEWVDGTPLSKIIGEGTVAERDEAGRLMATLHFSAPARAGLLHADPHPGNFKVLADGRLGVVDFGLVARMPDGLPSAMGRILSVAERGDAEQVHAQLKVEGFVGDDVDAHDLMEYLAPFVEPAAEEEFQFSREWMREQFIRVRDLQGSGGVGMRLNLPPSYLLIHRVWLGGLAVLSQLGVKAAFGRVLEEFLPGYTRD